MRESKNRSTTLVLLFMIIPVSICSCGNNTFQILIVMSNSSQFDTSVILPTVDLAISSINASSVLNGSTLCYSTVLDSRVSMKPLHDSILFHYITV